jgi:hypothetical protein
MSHLSRSDSHAHLATAATALCIASSPAESSSAASDTVDVGVSMDVGVGVEEAVVTKAGSSLLPPVWSVCPLALVVASSMGSGPLQLALASVPLASASYSASISNIFAMKECMPCATFNNDDDGDNELIAVNRNKIRDCNKCSVHGTVLGGGIVR